MCGYFGSFEMFTSQARIDRKTGPDDLGRFEYLQALVTEFQDTDRQGIHSMAISLALTWVLRDSLSKPCQTRREKKKRKSQVTI